MDEVVLVSDLSQHCISYWLRIGLQVTVDTDDDQDLPGHNHDLRCFYVAMVQALVIVTTYLPCDFSKSNVIVYAKA